MTGASGTNRRNRCLTSPQAVPVHRPAWAPAEEEAASAKGTIKLTVPISHMPGRWDAAVGVTLGWAHRTEQTHPHHLGGALLFLLSGVETEAG